MTLGFEILVGFEILEILEGLVIFIIIGFQIYIAYRLWLKIKEYRDIYNLEDLPHIRQKSVSLEVFETGSIDEILKNTPNEIEEGVFEKTVEIIYLKNISKRYVLKTIVKYINVYLIKNRGISIDFHIIKDIVDKHTETIENQIENRVPAPLYLGLAATMLGIIIGLFTVNFDNGKVALDAIQPLIDGVKYAMSASVIGLIITTLFSIKIYKDAQIETDEEKNVFLSKLQAELMPRMSKVKLPEVSILSSKLDAFAKNTIGAVSQLDSIVEKTRITVFQEKELLSEIRSMDVAKMTSANIKVFKKLDGMMESFENFAQYYESLDQSLKNTTVLIVKLKQFIDNTHNINVVLESIKEIVLQSKNANDFFNRHIKSFESYQESVAKAVSEADDKMGIAIGQLKIAVENQIDSYTNIVDSYQDKLEKVFDNSIERYSKAVDNQILKMNEAFNLARPKFEKLNKLDSIDKSLTELNRNILSLINSSNDNNILVNPKNSSDINALLGKITGYLRLGAYTVVVGLGIIYVIDFIINLF
jgi:hypothetical protein